MSGHRLTIELTMNIDAGDPLLFGYALAGRLEHIIGEEFREDGEDLMGYDGPLVTGQIGVKVREVDA